MLGGCQIRRGKLWRIAVVFAASGALALSGCASGGEPSGPATDTAAAAAAKVDEIANTVPEEIKSTRQADRRGQHSVHAQRVQGSQRQDRRLRRRPDERDRGHPRPDGGVPGGRLRQDHPLHPGRHLQRRHVVVHRHQGARGDGRLRHLLLGGHAVGAARRAPGSTPSNACGKKVAVQATTTQETEELPAKSKACTDAGKPPIEIVPFDGQDAATNAVVLGQADAVSADSPVILYAIKQSNGKLEAGRRDLRLRALRLAGKEGLGAGAVTGAGPRAPDRDRRVQGDRHELGRRAGHDRQAGDQRRDQLSSRTRNDRCRHAATGRPSRDRCRSAASSLAVGGGGRHRRPGRAVPVRRGDQRRLSLVRSTGSTSSTSGS